MPSQVGRIFSSHRARTDRGWLQHSSGSRGGCGVAQCVQSSSAAPGGDLAVADMEVDDEQAGTLAGFLS